MAARPSARRRPHHGFVAFGRAPPRRAVDRGNGRARRLHLGVAVAEPLRRDIMIRTFLWAGLALAWNIAGGYAGLISFGHAAFFGIGAYTSTILLLSYGVSPWIGLWAGAAGGRARERCLPRSARACAARSSFFRPWRPAR